MRTRDVKIGMVVYARGLESDEPSVYQVVDWEPATNEWGLQSPRRGYRIYRHARELTRVVGSKKKEGDLAWLRSDRDQAKAADLQGCRRLPRDAAARAKKGGGDEVAHDNGRR